MNSILSLKIEYLKTLKISIKLKDSLPLITTLSEDNTMNRLWQKNCCLTEIELFKNALQSTLNIELRDIKI